MESSPGRIAAVTGALMAFGAAFGALAAVLAAAGGMALTGEYRLAVIWSAMGAVAVVGAALGALLFPLAGWLFLRRVPLGLALLATFAGTVAGAMLTWVLSPASDVVVYFPGGRPPLLLFRPVQALLGAVAGFVCAAVILRLRMRRRRPAAERVAV